MLLGYLLLVLCVFIDQITKIIVTSTMVLNEQITFIPHIMNFHFTYNTGAAWSILSDHRVLLAIISVIASVFLCYLIKDFNMKKHPLYSISIVLVAAGAIGNLIDRVFRAKGVVDFLEFDFIEFPIFNIADTFLTIGVVLLAIYILFKSKDGTLPFMKKKEKKTETVEPQVEEHGE